MKTLWLKGRLALGLLAGGAVHALSFAPDPLPVWALSPLQLCAMAWLVTCVWRAPSGLYAARRAWFFALGHFVVGLYWLTTSMHAIMLLFKSPFDGSNPSLTANVIYKKIIYITH